MQRTFLSQMEITEGRTVVAYFQRVIEEDGKELARSNPHTIGLSPDTDHEATFKAVNQDITTREGMQWPPLPKEDWDRVVAHCMIEHTPEVKAAYELWKQDQLAKMNIP